MLIDTHAHLMLSDFDDDRDAVIHRAYDAGVNKIINVGCSIKGTEQSVDFLYEYDEIYGTAGVHPYDSEDVTDELMAKYESLFAEHKKLVALGETGLDYHREGSLIDSQIDAFKKHLELAKSLDVPIIIHCRDAKEDLLKLLDLFPGVRGVVHCFTYELEYARELWNRGIFTSFTGVVTYPNARYLTEVVLNAPEDMIMVETDAPYLAPQAFRSKRNEPSYVVEHAKMIAEMRSKSFEEVCEFTTKAALTLFNRLNP